RVGRIGPRSWGDRQGGGQRRRGAARARLDPLQSPVQLVKAASHLVQLIRQRTIMSGELGVLLLESLQPARKLFDRCRSTDRPGFGGMIVVLCRGGDLCARLLTVQGEVDENDPQPHQGAPVFYLGWTNSPEGPHGVGHPHSSYTAEHTSGAPLPQV